MKCYKCGKEVVDGEYKKVANWVFCNECFNSLLDDKKSDKNNKDISIKDSSLSNKKKDKKCQICGKPLSEKDAKSLLGLDFCSSCYTALLSKPKSKPRNPETESPKTIKYKVPQVETNLRETIECFGCGRKIPKAGAKEVDGHFYCPDCYRGLLDVLKESPHKTRLDTHTSTKTDKSNPYVRCQSCDRYVEKRFIKQVEGFDICTACLSSDRDTAIDIAKKRHRIFLQNLIKDLNSSDNI